MNRRSFLLSAAATGLATPALAARPAPVPAFTAVVDDASVTLEAQIAAFKSRTKAMGYGGADIFYELKGAASPVRLAAGQAVSFFSNEPETIDPQQRFGLFRLTPVKATRRLTTGKVNPFGYGTRNVKNQAAVEFSTVRDGGLWRITPTEPLTPGEYGLALAPNLGNNTWGWGGRGGGNQPVCAFGVD
ncbi:MAG: hypothetical protein GC145_03660 [Caulobacter sp.]|nr:hypothetical protein [Caulobacter sp.]